MGRHSRAIPRGDASAGDRVTAPRPVTPLHQPRRRRPLLTVKEVAGILRVSDMTVYRLIHAGDLASFRVGRSIRVKPESLDELLAGEG